jgi:hypothetical protein
MDLLARAYPGNTFKSMMTEGDPKALSELAMQVPIIGMTAYHGTPHKIKGLFDINKVGTGEGAQAYGHGMYFAESPKVADEYRKNLSGYVNNSKGVLNRHGGDFDKAIEETRNRIYEYNARNFAEADKPMAERMLKINEKKLEELQAMKAGIPESTGNLYKVDIPDEYIPNMLNWDKLFSEQPEKIKAIFGNVDKNNRISTQLAYERWMANNNLTPPEASKVLAEQGIPGIRYLDEGSRGTGKGTSNFVVFDPSTVKILEENSKPVSRKALIEEQVKKLKD